MILLIFNPNISELFKALKIVTNNNTIALALHSKFKMKPQGKTKDWKSMDIRLGTDPLKLQQMDKNG